MIYSHIDSKGIPLQKKLNNIFNNKKNGTFIELGGNDGLYQTNTAYFEKELGWEGILIEPSVKGYELCKKNRPRSVCLNFACVSDDYKEEYVKGNFKNNSAMGSIDGKRKRTKEKDLVSVKAITLEKILDKYSDRFKKIDFMSLDV